MSRVNAIPLALGILGLLALSGCPSSAPRAGDNAPAAADGPYVAYHPNGHRAVVGQYQGGKKVGKWTWYAPDGSVTRSELYKAGLLVDTLDREHEAAMGDDAPAAAAGEGDTLLGGDADRGISAPDHER